MMQPEAVNQGDSAMEEAADDKETRKMRIQRLLDEHQEMLLRLERDKIEKAALLQQAQEELARAKEESEMVRRLLAEATEKAQQAKLEEERLKAEAEKNSPTEVKDESSS